MTALADIIARLVDALTPDRHVCSFANTTNEDPEDN